MGSQYQAVGLEGCRLVVSFIQIRVVNQAVNSLHCKKKAMFAANTGKPWRDCETLS